jgi:hypothetical protein
LAAIIDNALKPHPVSEEMQRLEEEHAKHVRKTEEEEANARKSWLDFWSEIVRDPAGVFAGARADNTAWHLWTVMTRSGRHSRASGWNRSLIEGQFGEAVADQLRTTMMRAWRTDRPTLWSERERSEKDRFLVRWQFGLAGIAAEAENPNWAKRLTPEEAELACRYAPIELNGFPSWIESLAVAHPAAIDGVLGGELSASLADGKSAPSYSMLLQNILHAPDIVAILFRARTRTWLTQTIDAAPHELHVSSNIRQAVEVILKHAESYDLALIERLSIQQLSQGFTSLEIKFWLAFLLRVNAAVGVDALEEALAARGRSRVN